MKKPHYLILLLALFTLSCQKEEQNPEPQPVVKKIESGIEINQSASLNVYSEVGAGLHERISLAKFYFTP